MTSLLKMSLIAATALTEAPLFAQDQDASGQTATAAASPACSPEHAAMGHCTPPAPRSAPAQSRAAPPAQPACLPEHAAMGHCTLAPDAPTAKPQPSQTAASQPASPAQPTCLPEHAAMGHCTLPATAPATTPQPPPPAQSACLPEHAAMGHCKLPASPPTPQAACPPEHAAMGHCAPAAAATTAEGTNLPAGSGTAPPVPTDHAADAIYGPSAMAMGRHHLFQYHGAQNFFMAILNIAEVKIKNGRDGYEWGGEAWYGGDINRLVVKSEGEGDFAGVESAEVQALYSRAIDPYFDLQAGVRYDFAPDPSRLYATVGFEGLAPGFFEVEGALFLSDRGELMGRLEGYYDQRITQELTLQPRAEFNFAAQSSEDIGVGAGLVDAELGIRLRYDIAREFAPYVGVQYERAFGKTRDFRRDEGEATGGWSFLAGIRMWF